MTRFIATALVISCLSLFSCIDKDYDLSKVDTGDITIGGDNSEFRIPLATVKVDLTKMTQGSVKLEDIIAQTKVWLPDPLPAGAEYVDIPKLRSDQNYLDGIIGQLFLELRNSSEKLEALSEQLWETPSYRDQMLRLLNLPFNPTKELFKTALAELIAQQNIQVEDKITELASSYLKNQLAIDPVTFDVDGFDLDESIIDLLTKNLDKPNNSLHLYGRITSLLPVSVSFRGAEFKPTNITFSEITIEAEASGEIREAKVLRDDLRKITKGITIHLPVVLTKYYPKKEFNLVRKDQLTIELKMVKRGALSLKL